MEIRVSNGRATLDLYHALTHTPAQWPRLMLEIFPTKPNGLIWIGQFFVPLGYVIGSLDTALLLAIALMQFVTLVLIYRSLLELSFSALVVPLSGCLAVASAPMYISVAQHYLVEPAQMLSVAWFIFLMSMAPKWNRALLLVQLATATAFALLAKGTQPLFCLWPGLVACFYLIRPRHTASSTFRCATLMSLALGTPVILATLAWYGRNVTWVIKHILASGSGSGAATFWGKDDTYLNTFAYWVQTAQTTWFLPLIGELSLLIVASAVVYSIVKARTPWTHFTVCSAVAALQIMTVVLIFSLSPTRGQRYLVPALPYLALLVGWSVARLNHWATSGLTIAAFAFQLVLLHGQALNATEQRSPLLRPFDRHAQSGRVLEAVVARTCAQADASTSWNILAIDPSIPELGGDWLAPEPANYVVGKSRFRNGGALPCHFGYLGDGFFGDTVSRSWDLVLTRQTRFVITVDPSRYPVPQQVYNQSS